MAKQVKQRIRSKIGELLETKNLDTLNISKLCDDLNLHRQSFYYHYPNIESVLMDYYHQEIHDTIVLFKQYDQWIIAFNRLLNYINHHQKRIQHTFYSSYQNMLLEALYKEINEYIKEGILNQGKSVTMDIDVLSNLYSNFILENINYYIKENGKAHQSMIQQFVQDRIDGSLEMYMN